MPHGVNSRTAYQIWGQRLQEKHTMPNCKCGCGCLGTVKDLCCNCARKKYGGTPYPLLDYKKNACWLCKDRAHTKAAADRKVAAEAAEKMAPLDDFLLYSCKIVDANPE